MIEFISKNPGVTAILFGFVNLIWAIFLYFNSKKHHKNLELIKHDLNLDLERRKKVYEMKVNQYEKYYKLIDEFGKEYSIDLPQKMQPIISEYFNKYLEAQFKDDKDEIRKILVWFNNQISNLMFDINENYFRLISETNSLKLTSSIELLEIFDDLQKCYNESFNISNEFISRFLEIIQENNQTLLENYKNKMKGSALKLKTKSDDLMSKMRLELTEI